jgi:AAA family ATP:ADP antiporter
VPAPEPPPASLVRRVALVREGETAALVLSALYFFFLLSAYYILRPVRDALGIEGGADDLPWLVTGTLAAMLLANPLFSAVVSRFPRRVFIPWTYRSAILCLLAFFLLSRVLAGAPRVWLGYAYYIWLSVFNLFAVSVFWAFMADIWTTEQSKRLFVMIGVGGTLGTLAGSALTVTLVKVIGTFPLLLVSAVLLECAVQCASGLIRARSLGRADRAPPTPEPGPGFMEGLRLIVRSRYLLLLCLYMLIYTILATFLWLRQQEIIAAAVTSRDARTALSARIDLAANAITIAMQLFVAGRFIRRFGVGIALAVLPAVNIVGFVMLGAAPAMGLPLLAVVVAFVAVRRGLHYALSQPTRQILFTVLSQDAKYKSKPFIDTFVYRTGDLIGAWTPRQIVAALALLGVSATAAVPLAAVPLASVILGIGLALGRMQRRRARIHEAAAVS